MIDFKKQMQVHAKCKLTNKSVTKTIPLYTSNDWCFSTYNKTVFWQVIILSFDSSDVHMPVNANVWLQCHIDSQSKVKTKVTLM